MSVSAYAELPYQSLPQPQAHPAYLALLGRLHGLDPADPHTARVLEIGCAAGGHLIPIAWYQPGCHCVGFEADAGQAQDARRLVASLGLANCAVHAEPATAARMQGLGPFDYIICHGVYSWVDDGTRADLLHGMAGALADDGLAFVSYNTLPGWHLRGMLREQLRYHTEGIEPAEERLQAAREMMDWLETHLQGVEALSAQYLRAEFARIRAAHPSYLLHEFLAPENCAFLYTDFLTALRAVNLHPVCDADLTARHAPALPEHALAAIEVIPERDEQEQYLDFLLNRNLRSTVVARRPAAGPDWGVVERASLRSSLRPPRKIDWQRPRPARFRRNDGAEVEVHHPWTKVALQLLAARYPAALAWADLVGETRAEAERLRLAPRADAAQHLFGELASLMIQGAISAVAAPTEAPPVRGEHLNRLARAMLECGRDHITGPAHLALPIERDWVEPLLDGSAAQASGALGACWASCQLLGLTEER